MNYKTNYSMKEWIDRKKYYIEKAFEIQIPIESTEYELKVLISKTNNLLTEAYLDKAAIAEMSSRIDRQVKIFEQESWATIDWKSISRDKLLKEEKSGYVISYIKKVTSEENEGMDVYKQQQIVNSRYAFIESVVYSLKDKAMALAGLLNLLKIEKERTKYDGYYDPAGNQKC